jgi:lysyl-tRNA synthetase class 2
MTDTTQKTEDALIEARRTKASNVRSRGQNPFANDADADDREMVGSLRRRFESARSTDAEGNERYSEATVAEIGADKPVRLFGRMMARRGFGKASFLRLRDVTGEIQVFAKKDEMGESFDALKDIDMADHIEVVGPIMVTKTGELSVLARSLRLLTKALRPLPDKWHGLTQVEQRYRHRYVDTVANPAVGDVFRARTLIIQGLRDFLDRRSFLEVETPTLHSVIGGAAAHPFTTHHNALDLSLFLRIAPELYLKRLLVGGFERVYEVARCYRNEGTSTRHNPEFTMLEFYQAYATYETLMPLTEELFRHVDGFFFRRMEDLGRASVVEQWVEQRTFTLDEPFARVPMHDAIVRSLESAGLDAGEVLGRLSTIGLLPSKEAQPVDPAVSELVGKWAKTSERAGRIDWTNLRKGLSACESDGERTFAAYEYFAEPFLVDDYRSRDGSKSVPTFILDYPAAVSPLARRRDDTPELTERFELFVDGIERCNAFSELNDPEDQAARFRAQVEKKSRGVQETMDYDADYIRALEHGMPPAAGFGLGVDRFVMMLTGQPSIRDVIAFPLLRPEGRAS